MATPEGKVKRKISALLKKYRNLYYFMPVQNGMGKPGLDYHCSFRGRAFCVEAKAEKGRLTERQKLTIEELRLSGAAVFVVRDDVTLDSLASWLDRLNSVQGLMDIAGNPIPYSSRGIWLP